MLRLAFDFIITWRETRTRPNAYFILSIEIPGGLLLHSLKNINLSYQS